MTLLRNPNLLGGRIIQPGNGVLRPWSPGIGSFAALERFFPINIDTAPGVQMIIEHDATFTNYAPVGWVVDPTDATRFLLYVNKFDHNLDDGSKLTVYGGLRSDPYSVSLIGDALVKGGNGAWDARGIYLSGSQVINDNGTIRVMYSGRADVNDYCRLGVATSADGRTFTKFAGNPVVVPPAEYRDPAGGYQSGALAKVGNGYYFYLTTVETTPVLATFGLQLLTSTDFESWVDTRQTVVEAEGGTGEAGHAFPLGSDVVFLYDVSANQNGHPYYHVNLAHSTGPTSLAIKDVPVPSFFSPTRHVACVRAAEMTPGAWVLYFTRHNAGTDSWDVCALPLN